MSEYQKTLRMRIDDLVSTLNIRNISWTAWERNFIEDMGKKLAYDEIKVTDKQDEIIQRLWEKI